MTGFRTTLVLAILGLTLLSNSLFAQNRGSKSSRPSPRPTVKTAYTAPKRTAPTRTTYSPQKKTASRPVTPVVKNTPRPTPTNRKISGGNNPAGRPNPFLGKGKTPVGTKKSGPVVKGGKTTTAKGPVGPKGNPRTSTTTINTNNRTSVNVNQNNSRTSTTLINNNATTVVRNNPGVAIVPIPVLPPVVGQEPPVVVIDSAPPVTVVSGSGSEEIESQISQLAAERERLLTAIARLEEAIERNSNEAEREDLLNEIERLRGLITDNEEPNTQDETEPQEEPEAPNSETCIPVSRSES